jgi:predicted RNase H-like HicB family nuclease
MRYPIAIEPGTDATAWGVVVPDLPGCFSAGDTLEDAMIQARQTFRLQPPQDCYTFLALHTH